MAVYAAVAITGMAWGLPTSRIDRLLFGNSPVWSGEEIARLNRASDKFDAARGADVDADPVVFAGDAPVDLTATEADVAAIYQRYRLYTHQPDEMITMMALAGMRPAERYLDPKLYQYGGLFIYPVGAIIALGGVTGIIEVTSDLTYYLDHPDEFGRFYVAARAYVALWGALGVVLVYAIASRLGGFRAGALAALLFTLAPVVVCMSHEAKPHLPGAVLMLAAVWWAMCYVERGWRRDWAGLCITCGAAFGMVLSSLPIFVLIPLAELIRGANFPNDLVSRLGTSAFWRRVLGGAVIGLLVYLATNPYVAINAVVNREVLQSNLSNSTAMYEVGRFGEGLVRVIELTVEGVTLPVAAIGVIGLVFGIRRGRRDLLPLVVPAGLILVQFVMLGAGKPAEYGRFGVFPDTALAISTGCLLTAGWRTRAARAIRNGTQVICALAVLSAAYFSSGYLYDFHKDSGPDNNRERINPLLQQLIRKPVSEPLSDRLSSRSDDGWPVVCVLADPAPYCLPPMNFARIRLLRYPSLEAYRANPQGVLVVPEDFDPPEGRNKIQPPQFTGTRRPPYSPISWANKPMALHLPAGKGDGSGQWNTKARTGN